MVPISARAWLKRVGAAGTIGLCLAATLVTPPMGATAAGVAPLPIGSTTLRYGDVGPAVRVLQGDLAQFGFNPGPVDGIFGPKTLAALRGFQTSSHIIASGILDAATFHVVLEDLGYDTPSPSTGSGGRGSQSPSGTHAQILAYWAVWGSNATALRDLRQHGSATTWLSPYWYTLRGNGTLSSREADHAQVTSAAAAVGVPVLALINQGSGLATLLSSASGRNTAVNAIARMLKGNPGISGVVIDFELLPPSSRNNLTAFVQQLRSALPRSETVGVAVMPKASSPGPDYAQVFDYAALGQAADFIQLMTYDRHSDSSGPGPISPNTWVAQVARYAAGVIPAKKILLGVPGYGYDWTSGGSTASIDATQALATASARGIQPTYDPASGENHFTYYDNSGRLHTVWFEAAQGVAGKYDLVQQLGLGGLALWTIGGEQPAFWPAAEGQG